MALYINMCTCIYLYTHTDILYTVCIYMYIYTYICMIVKIVSWRFWPETDERKKERKKERKNI